MKKIIFVCLGNICRSSLAEGVAKAKIEKNNLDIRVESAGLSHYHNGEPPCLVSQDLANEHGVDISKQVSQHISDFNLRDFDLIVAMDESNYKELRSLGLEHVKKLGNFGFNGKDVADLYYEPHKRDEVWNMIDKVTDILLLNTDNWS